MEAATALGEHVATCSRCEKHVKGRPNKSGGLKLPKSWRAIDGEMVCKDCVRNAYYTRSIRVQIVGLAENEERDMAEFRRALSAAAKASARYGNWLVQQLYMADQAAGPRLERTKDGKEKLPPCPTVDGYRPDLFPELSGGCISGLMQMVRGWYSARRYDALVALNRSIENYRFGYLPVEVRKQDWSLRTGEDGKLVIHCGVTPGKSWKVRVYADKINYTRLKQIQSGDAIPLGMKIIRASKQPIAGGDGKPRKAWFFRLAAMFPRKAKRQSHQEITLTLGHDRESLLFGSLEGSDDVFEFPGVTLKKLIVGGDKADRRWQQENSMMRGIWSRRKRERWQKDRTRMSENRQRKIQSQIKLCAAALARWCKSHGVTSVDYDTTNQGFVPHFPWRALKESISFALEREAIGLHAIGGEESNNDEST